MSDTMSRTIIELECWSVVDARLLANELNNSTIHEDVAVYCGKIVTITLPINNSSEDSVNVE